MKDEKTEENINDLTTIKSKGQTVIFHLLKGNLFRRYYPYQRQKKYDVIVIGAGFAGTVFARVMAEANKKVLVIEKRATIGGNMYDEYVEDILIHKYGPHIFHTNHQKVFDFLKQFAPWYFYEHRVVGKIDGKLVPIPFNFTSIDTLFDGDTVGELKTKLISAFGSDKIVSVFELLKHPDECIKDFGQYVYNKVFAGYTAKQWAMPIDKIDTSTINRVPVIIGYEDKYFSDSIQMMPQNGYTHLFTELLSHKNITVKLNTNAKDKIRICFNKQKIFFEEEKYKGILFFTGAVDELLDYKYGILPYRSLNLVFENIEREQFQTAPVVNYPNEEDWTRITEFKHFTIPEKSKSKQTVILKEYPLSYNPEMGGERFYPIINETNKAIYDKYVHHLLGFDNLYLCGRLAEYKYYNMDAVVARALEIGEKINAATRTKFRLPVSLVKEIILYALIGLCCATLDSVVFLFLRKIGINLYVSNFISVNLGIISSFLLNTFVNFKVKDKLKIRAVKFFAVGYGGLALSMLIMHIGVDILNGREMFIKILSVFIVAAVQFTINKLFTFKKKNP
jgi:UDP-galactopyranose mutase